MSIIVAKLLVVYFQIQVSIIMVRKERRGQFWRHNLRFLSLKLKLIISQVFIEKNNSEALIPDLEHELIFFIHDLSVNEM